MVVTITRPVKTTTSTIKKTATSASRVVKPALRRP